MIDAPKAEKKKNQSNPKKNHSTDKNIGTSVSLCAVDLFAGAGGFSLAASKEEFKLIAAIENAKWAKATYTRNFISGKPAGTAPILYSDICETEPKTILEDSGLGPKTLDLLMGGPPCQGFSTHRIKDAGVKDPRNDLLLRYFDFVETLAPKVFLVENVSGLLWDRHQEYVEKFKSLAAKSGYRIVGNGPQLLNARDYGVPQNRKRVFILGIREDLNHKELNLWPPPQTHFSPSSKEVLVEGKQPWVTASKVFVEPVAEDDINNISMKPGKEMLKRFKATPANGGSRSETGFTLPCHKRHDGHKDVYGRIDPSVPGPTMTTGCINPSRGRFVHPTQHNGISARHAARFQTFPDDFIFEGGLGNSGRQIGNAVPIELGRKIIAHIKREILRKF